MPTKIEEVNSIAILGICALRMQVKFSYKLEEQKIKTKM